MASETPKTEELEEELRDQVLDVQNPIYQSDMVNNDIKIGMLNIQMLYSHRRYGTKYFWFSRITIPK